MKLLVLGLLGFLGGSCVGSEGVADGEQLAQRFRPYYKFSVDRGGEPCRPCSWQWFVAHGELYRGAKRLATAPELAVDPHKILSFPDADIRTTHEPFGVLTLRARTESRSGEPWETVINDGAGLYAQCEDAGNDFVVITYWTLFAYNKTTVTGDHEGDIIALSVLYDRRRDGIVRASYGIHGAVLESFDLVSPKAEKIVELRGVDAGNHKTSVNSKRIQASRAYQNGPFWHSPSRAEIYLVQDPVSKRWDHLAAFCEWGAHEPWPNPSGSVRSAPKHRGDSVSFLPKRVRYLGSLRNPVAKEAPFVFFNGIWGNDPKGIVFHRSCFFTEGRARNHFKIPGDKFVDRDPFDGRGLRWPPAR